MKTAYELAMERLNKDAPVKRLTNEQRAKLAEVESFYAAKLAEREIMLKSELAKAQAAGDPEAIAKCQQLLADETQKLRAERDAEKEKIRQQG